MTELFIIITKHVACFVGACMFALFLNAPKRTILVASIISLIEYSLYLFLQQIDTPYLFCYFAASLVASFMCEIAAKCLKSPSTVFSYIAVLILVPGIDIYKTVSMFVFGQFMEGAQTGIRALLSIGAMAMAIALSVLVMRILRKILSSIKSRRAERQA